MILGDAVEGLIWFASFWIFVFSEKFRAVWIKKFKDACVLGKLVKLTEALFATAIGLLPVAALAYFVVNLFC